MLSLAIDFFWICFSYPLYTAVLLSFLLYSYFFFTCPRCSSRHPIASILSYNTPPLTRTSCFFTHTLHSKILFTYLQLLYLPYSRNYSIPYSIPIIILYYFLCSLFVNPCVLLFLHTSTPFYMYFIFLFFSYPTCPRCSSRHLPSLTLYIFHNNP